ncbi:hypothetical protein JCM19239_4383 [Vibrio variabilis]|uniref:Uncharacterized protein n=1 Tax=Vibrio variabilis TaxID=990271 RepID=A0ABQ0JE67_9VIBR|nr:hypothetical protein JCM19239_4383 [Vibrio variabilis]
MVHIEMRNNSPSLLVAEKSIALPLSTHLVIIMSLFSPYR